MPEQLGLFGARRSAHKTCPRWPGSPLCADARERAEGCPGTKACEEWPNRKVAAVPDTSPLPGENLERFSARLGLSPEDLAQDLGVGPPDFGCGAVVFTGCGTVDPTPPRPANLRLVPAERTCGACGCTEAERPITFYEGRAPFPELTGYRCWQCAQAAMSKETSDG